MILPMEAIQALPEFEGWEKERLQRRLDALEELVRAYTNNHFQNRAVRFRGFSEGRLVNGSSLYLREADTVQITESQVNDGLYIVAGITEAGLQLDRELFPAMNLVTKVEYPADVCKGVLNLLRWEVENRDKVGIKSETLSRRSVTYFDQDNANTAMGYPVSLLGFLAPYRKARF